MTKEKMLPTLCRRLKFEMLKAIGIFWIIDRIPFLVIKQPWEKMYRRSAT